MRACASHRARVCIHMCACTARCLSFHPMAQCVVHALKGLACRARVTLSLRQARLPRTVNSAQCSRRLRSTHAEVTKNITLFSLGPKLRHPAVYIWVTRLLRTCRLHVVASCRGTRRPQASHPRSARAKPPCQHTMTSVTSLAHHSMHQLHHLRALITLVPPVRHASPMSRMCSHTGHHLPASYLSPSGQSYCLPAVRLHALCVCTPCLRLTCL